MWTQFKVVQCFPKPHAHRLNLHLTLSRIGVKHVSPLEAFMDGCHRSPLVHASIWTVNRAMTSCCCDLQCPFSLPHECPCVPRLPVYQLVC